jgi:hypothetical protein
MKLTVNGVLWDFLKKRDSQLAEVNPIVAA